ncbi:hypothetical protein pb186bvf_005199 [Paramecium bursaria]
MVRAFLQYPPELMPFQNNFYIQLAKSMLKKCKNLISLICKQKVTDQMINIYFSQNRFIYFSHNSNYLMGLSSYHGRLTYINLNLSPMDLFVTIIHEFAHNISRFLMKKKKVTYISPKKNKKLRALSSQKNNYINWRQEILLRIGYLGSNMRIQVPLDQNSSNDKLGILK